VENGAPRRLRCSLIGIRFERDPMLKALDITKSYDAGPLFADLSLVLAPGERVGLVGPNGAGKSTLLRLLAGRERPDRGAVTLLPGVRAGYLPQEAPAGTLDDLLREAIGPAWDALAELADPDSLDAYERALERVEATGGWAVEARVEEARRRLGIEHLPGDAPLERLSGGEQARALLAATLLGDPGVLLLDEPTNHLDAEGLEWLEGFLAAFDGALIVVSHDRRFLDAVVTRIVELRPGEALEAYEGGYTAYRDEKARRHRRLEELAEAQDKRRRRLEADITATRGYAQRTERTASGLGSDQLKRYAKKVAKKSKARERRLERELASTDWVQLPREPDPVRLRLEAAADRGRRVAALREVDAMRGDRTVLEGVDLALYGGERIAVAGLNGAGKTTLLALLLGTLAPSAGEVDVATEVRLLPQRPHELAATGPLLPWFRGHARRRIDEGEARTLLAHFGIGEAAVHRPLERLSPGQRSRGCTRTLEVRDGRVSESYAPAARGAVGSPPSSPACSRASQFSISIGSSLERSTTRRRSDIVATSSTCSLMNHCRNCSLV
jgi:ATPase subunit of ABC transporter with duplicated ATPase domains